MNGMDSLSDPYRDGSSSARTKAMNHVITIRPSYAFRPSSERNYLATPEGEANPFLWGLS